MLVYQVKIGQRFWDFGGTPGFLPPLWHAKKNI